MSRSRCTVWCLRPESDFASVGVAVPGGLDVVFAENERAIDRIAPEVACLVLPSAGAALDARLFVGATGLRLVQYTGAGFDRVARSVTDALGCAVCNVPGASAKDVASYVVLVAGTLLRRLAEGDALMKTGRYGEARAALSPARVRGFRGLRVGVVGLGSIGAEVAELFEALGADVAWFDAFDSSRPVAARLPRLGFEELLEFAELLTVHVPLSDETTGLIDAAALKRLPEGAVVVNAARGGVVDEAALIAQLEEGRLGGFALDVYATEPLPADSPITAAAWRHPERVVLTPHVAGVTPEASRELFVRSWENVRAVLIDGSAPSERVR